MAWNVEEGHNKTGIQWCPFLQGLAEKTGIDFLVVILKKGTLSWSLEKKLYEVCGLLYKHLLSDIKILDEKILN